jgi:hypothetical protein
MPFKYTIAEEEKVIYLIAEGILDLESSCNIIDELARSPNFYLYYHVLADIRKAKPLSDLSDMLELAMKLGQIGGANLNKVAVVTNEGFDYEKVNLTAHCAEIKNYSFKVFTSIDDAKQWLLTS